MADHERCVFCRREVAAQADWDRNAEVDDDQAAAEGLDDLCWEPGEQECLLETLERGRPTLLADALSAFDATKSRLDSLIKGLEERRDALYEEARLSENLELLPSVVGVMGREANFLAQLIEEHRDA